MGKHVRKPKGTALLVSLALVMVAALVVAGWYLWNTTSLPQSSRENTNRAFAQITADAKPTAKPAPTTTTQTPKPTATTTTNAQEVLGAQLSLLEEKLNSPDPRRVANGLAGQLLDQYDGKLLDGGATLTILKDEFQFVRGYSSQATVKAVVQLGVKKRTIVLNLIRSDGNWLAESYAPA